VLVREIARSPAVGNQIDEVRGVFQSLERMIVSAKERGEVRADCDPRLAAWTVYGALEEILTGWVLGQLPAEESDVERAVVTVVDVAHAGLAA
jgi:TetR/AcrR family transcriptional regulator, fatty acid metabolism regulator protein